MTDAIEQWLANLLTQSHPAIVEIVDRLTLDRDEAHDLNERLLSEYAEMAQISLQLRQELNDSEQKCQLLRDEIVDLKNDKARLEREVGECGDGWTWWDSFHGR